MCKGTCSRYQAPMQVHRSRYENGQKRCQVCCIFIVWTEDSCPCCGAKLRTKSRNHKSKTVLLIARI
jgi:hypothetical protein